jgi:HAMP domain-containing protein
MRFPLRRQILLLTVPPLAALGVASLWIVHEHVSTQVHASLREDLRRAAAVFESVLEQRAHTLSVLGAAIAEDPKFFSVLAIPASHDDPQLRATVEGVAGDFAGIAQSDRFEVLDEAGRTLATVGRDASPAPLPQELVRRALMGERVVAVIGRGAEPYQVSLTPVRAGNRRVGVLVLGARLGDALAQQMRDLTRSEVTFVSGGTVRASTVDDPADLSALLDGLRGDAGWPASRSAPPLIAEAAGRGHAWLALARAIPGAAADEPHHYVMQRALDRETAFLTRLQGTLVQFGIAAVIAVLLAAIAISTRITAPLQRLMRGAEEMERGNYEWPLDIRRGDEIGVLAGRFDDMRRRQRATVENLQELARLRSEFIAVASHELRTP